MSRVPKVIPSLVGGVSQQPPGLRFPGQVEECENAWLSQVDGAAKRPPTEHVAKILDSVHADASFHVIEREGQDYVLVLEPASASLGVPTVRVFDLTGTELEVVADATGDEDALPVHYFQDDPDNYIGDASTIGTAGLWTLSDQATVAASAEVGPLGYGTAAELGGSGADGLVTHTVDHVVQARLGARGCAASIYIKQNDALNYIRLSLRVVLPDGTKQQASAFYQWSGSDLQVDLLQNNPSGTETTEDVGGGWWRAVFSFDMSDWPELPLGLATDWEPGLVIDRFQVTYSTAATGDFDYVWGPRLEFKEDGAFPSPLPEPTTGLGPMRFLTVSDSTFILNTAWRTRTLDNIGRTRGEFLDTLTEEPSEVLVVDFPKYYPSQDYNWEITNSAGTFSGTVTTPAVYRFVDLAQDVVDDIIAASGSFSGSTASFTGGPPPRGQARIRSTSSITAFSFTGTIMQANLATVNDRLLVAVQEAKGGSFAYTWDVTNDAGNFSGTYNSSSTNGTVIAAGIASDIASADASLASTTSVNSVVIVQSTTEITASAFVDPELFSFDEYVADVAYFFVQQGIDGVDYNWEITNGAGTFSGTVTAGAVNATDSIASSISTQIQDADASLYGTISNGSVVEVRSLSKITDFYAKDDAGDTVFTAFRDEVDTLSDLPVNFRSGYRIRVSPDPSTDLEDYFATFQREDGTGAGFGKGVWVESTDWGAESEFDGASMPPELALRTDDESGTVTGTAFSAYFLLAPASWTAREAGDDGTNPPPSFDGKKLSDILFHANRLGFLSDQNLIMSEAGVFFNFWSTTNLTTVDSDPVDVATNETRLSTLRTHGELSEQLIVTSDHSQFTLSGSPVSPSTAILNRVAGFNVSAVPPASHGRALVFASNGSEFAEALEFFRAPGDSTTLRLASEDVTQAIPKYITGDVEILQAYPREGVYFLKAADDNVLYVYRSAWSGQKRTLAAWSKWTFAEGVTIRHFDFTETDMVLLVERTGGLFLETITLGDGLTDAGQDLRVHLDRRVRDTDLTVAYNATDNETTFTSASLLPGLVDPAVVRTDGVALPLKHHSSGTVAVHGDHSSEDVWVGEKYAHSMTLTEPIPQRGGPSGPIPRHGRYVIQSLEVQVAGTAAFEVNITPAGYGQTYTHQHTAQTVGGLGEAGSVLLQDDPVQVGIFAPARGLVVELRNETALPSRFTGLVWHGDLSPHTPAL